MTTIQSRKVRYEFKKAIRSFLESIESTPRRKLINGKRRRTFKESDELSDNIEDVLDVTFEIIDSLPRDDPEEYVWDGGERDGKAVMYAYATFADEAAMKKLVKKAVTKIKTMSGVSSVDVTSHRNNNEELVTFTIVVSFDGMNESTRFNRIPGSKHIKK